MKSNKYTCFFDGACVINPGGKMGIGAVIYNEKDCAKLEHSLFIDTHCGNSNNVAEYMAILWVIKELVKICSPGDFIEINGDSMLVVKQLNGKWRIKDGAYKPYALKTVDALNELKGITQDIDINWIPREQNDYADFLSKRDIV